MSIKDNLKNIKKDLPPHVTLVAVSKTKPIEDILQAYEAGQRIFGENKAQEMHSKHEKLPKDIQWHMIGTLQTNKVKYIAPFVDLIHSVEREKLLAEIDKRAKANNRTIKCLFQVHIAEEESKFGFDEEELMEFLASGRLQRYANVNVVGLMGMATNTNEKAKVQEEFHKLSNLFKKLKKQFFPNSADFNTLSMGMSQDYEQAIYQGSTMLRIGSSIFGNRNYT